MTISSNVLQDYMSTWLGYGNPNGKYWFIGLEETFGRWDGQNDRQDLEEYVLARRDFDRTTDLRVAIEDVHGYTLADWSGPSTWKYQAAFLMHLDEQYPVISAMSDVGREAYEFVFEEANLARTDSGSLTAELLPLPRPVDDIKPLHEDRWTSHAAYRRAVLPTRINLLWETLCDNERVEYVVVYGKNNEASLGLRALATNSGTLQRELQTGPSVTKVYSLEVGLDRTVTLLHTPFFGVGQLSYDGVSEIADIVVSG